MKKFLNYYILIFFLILLEVFSRLNIIAKYLLPAPSDVIKVFFKDYTLLLKHSFHTFFQALLGLLLATILSIILSILMDISKRIYSLIYPILIISQTIPIIAISPLILIWLGYTIKAKIVIIVISSFFPITISIIDAFKTIPKMYIKYFKFLGANKLQTYLKLKIPYSLESFFSGLKIAASYSIINTIIAEWLGGSIGLGVYLNIAKRSYDIDKMFAAIFLISVFTLIIVKIIEIIKKNIIRWE